MTEQTVWTSVATTSDYLMAPCRAQVLVNGLPWWACERPWGHDGPHESREHGGVLAWRA